MQFVVKIFCLSLIMMLAVSPTHLSAWAVAQPAPVQIVQPVPQEPVVPEIKPGHETAAAYSNRCLTYLQMENYPAAIADCTQALQRNEQATEARLNRGLAYYRQGHFLSAIADYDRLLNIQPDDFRAYYNRGLAELALRRYPVSLADFNQSLQYELSDPTQAEVLIERGLAYLMLTRFESAIADFTQAIQTDQTLDRAYYNRACAYHQQGDNWAALADFDRVLALLPNDPQAHFSRGRLHQQLGNPSGAMRDLRQAAQTFHQQGQIMAYEAVRQWISRIQSHQTAIG